MTNISRRRFLKFAGGAASAGLLAACAVPAAQPQAANPTAPAEDESKPTEAPQAQGAYQGKFVVMSAGNADQNNDLYKAIEAEHPGVKLEWRGLTSERYTELFAAAEVAGDQIDIMDLNGQDLRRYAVGGKLRDLTDLSYPKDRFREIGLKTYTIKGKLWALPRGGISGFPFLYNKKVLDKIGVTKEPETYTDLLPIAAELKKANIAPFAHAGKNIYLWPIWHFWAHGQTSGNQPTENTFKTLNGAMKFTDPEHVQALEMLAKYADDKMFIEGVNSLDSDGAWLAFSTGRAAFFYEHSWRFGFFRENQDKLPELELSMIAPLRMVDDPNIKRMAPGGTGSATGIYAKIAPEREQVALSILDMMTNDKWVAWANKIALDPVSCNKNVQASDDPLALKYAKECADNQVTYEDWYWPPEITRAFQENQQAVVASSKKPAEAAQAIQKTLEDLYKDGYKFEI
ncbi:MAG: ABC transporter substrate-binding protein [Chloroflexi bacterium]|nr:ABC transporter substrate-binding protein [Chloroflexota bacterium]